MKRRRERKNVSSYSFTLRLASEVSLLHQHMRQIEIDFLLSFQLVKITSRRPTEVA